ncbi:DUF3419 family protein [Martelella endophytica]|uniref:S-adenosylmethionine:diacylglycerol 3-amino-3-carboxypropyl transferase n=1 Tax=Martelella endophytica TaxID=1486262 RepID=A0A0D5LQQ5_MAREN|nr:DUF3419 family protein [Martelella endophytica]AJY46441.1 S-adenosylmethionine:diacylglycerol 3-amino-3-carboxypropyl transferase [Martelella endophytica]
MSAIAEQNGGNRLKTALLQHRALTKEGLSERLFGLMFSGLVYPQIWEDPDVDMAAMELGPGHSVVTIGSGGCNVLAYLTRAPEHIDVVDLNTHHIALNRLKLAAFRHLPDHAAVLRLFGNGEKGATSDYDRLIAPHLDTETRRYWEGRDSLGRRRITVFERNIYRTGLLGHFIGAGHMVARLHGVNISELTEAKSLREQRHFFEEKIAPLFDKPLIRWTTSRKSSLFGLGIPPRQYDELASASEDGTLASVLRQRLEKLACHFPLKDNYFAWQAFARAYPDDGPVPTYLQAEAFPLIRDNAKRATVHHASFTELLSGKDDESVDRYVLLDAQDWMNDDQLNALWSEMTRTAREGARVIFRTAAEGSVVEGRLQAETAGGWRYLADTSRELGLLDRSAIYGGFHIYERL